MDPLGICFTFLWLKMIYYRSITFDSTTVDALAYSGVQLSLCYLIVRSDTYLTFAQY